MTAVACEANRPWDGRRLLRFLTGLAMLALAVTLRLPGPAVAEPVSPPAAAAVVAAGASASASVVVLEPEPEPAPEIAPAEAPASLPLAHQAALTGVIPATGGSRAPPTR